MPLAAGLGREPAASPTFTYLVFKNGNNTDPLKRALDARGWSGVDVADTRAADTWNVNFIWKPTWSKDKPPPPTFARGAANPVRRQMWNHWKAVEPLCTKDSLFMTVRTAASVAWRGMAWRGAARRGACFCWSLRSCNVVRMWMMRHRLRRPTRICHRRGRPTRPRVRHTRVFSSTLARIRR
jgi:hypothetical protein